MNPDQIAYLTFNGLEDEITHLDATRLQPLRQLLTEIEDWELIFSVQQSVLNPDFESTNNALENLVVSWIVWVCEVARQVACRKL